MPLSSSYNSPSKYDAFKSFSDIHAPLVSVTMADNEPFAKKETRNTIEKEVPTISPDLFKDFAVSAFNEFKRDFQHQPKSAKLF